MGGESADVNVPNAEPMPVAVVAPVDTPAQSTARETAASAGVDAEILRTEDQRRISGMWERTQQVVALSVVEVTLVVVTMLVLLPGIGVILGNEVPNFMVTASVAGMLFLTGIANLVIGFYFGRTNHERVGGVATSESR